MEKVIDLFEFGITEYVNEVDKYLASKLPELSEHTRMEITAYIGNRACCLVTNSILENNREWSAIINRRK